MVTKKNLKNSRVASRGSRKVKDVSDQVTSKYFQNSDVKTEEPENMSDHSEDRMVIEGTSPSKQVKEEEEDSEDEDDWEEVEGMRLFVCQTVS